MPKLLGRKVGMTRVIQDDGAMVPVTVISVPNSIITQIKTEEKDGYAAVVLGFDALKKPTKTKKFRVMKEFRSEEGGGYEVGKELGLDLLEEVKKVSLVSTSKGKGFAGVIKRWNFSRGPETHGSRHHREPGSVGACAAPGKIAKGKKLPGRMGNKTVTRHKVDVVRVDKEKHLLAIKGAVAGANGGVVYIHWKTP
jgi:large subunit ribosomal protein L3